MASALSRYDAAEVIRLLRRRAHRLDQTSVASMAGLAQSTVSRIEAGRQLGLERSLKVFQALNAPTAPVGQGPGSPQVPATMPAQASGAGAPAAPHPEPGVPQISDVFSHTPTLRHTATHLGQGPLSRPVGLRPHIERAFAAEDVTIDFAGFSSETLHGALQEPLDRVREQRMAPHSIRIRILVPDLSQPRGLPVRTDTGQDDPQVRARMRRIMLRYTQGIEDLVRELQHLGLVPTATVHTRVYPIAPMFKIYLINAAEAFFGFYPVKANLVPLGNETVEIHDLLGRDSLLFRHTADDDPESVGSQYVAQAQAWFDSIWNSIAQEPAE